MIYLLETLQWIKLCPARVLIQSDKYLAGLH